MIARQLLAIAAVLTTVMICTIAEAQSGMDRVVVQPAGSTSRVTVRGSIVDYTGQGLVVQPSTGGKPLRYRRDEVIEVITEYGPRHLAGRQLLNEGQCDEADAAFREALDEEDRTWVRRELLASQVKCSLWKGDLQRAAQRFLPLARSDADSLYFGLIPLVWQEASPESASAAEAQRLLQGDSTARLIGASWLFAGERAAALRTLNELASDPLPAVQRLAQAQLWRVRLESRDVTPGELQRWLQFVDELRPELRAGPQFLIGRGYAQRQEHLSAAAAWLWLPMEFPENRHLAADAQFRAAEALGRAGDAAAARRLLHELQQKYNDTPAASQGDQLRQRLSGKP